jgi:hypothetical protein
VALLRLGWKYRQVRRVHWRKDEGKPDGDDRGALKSGNHSYWRGANRASAEVRPIPPLWLKDDDMIEVEIPRIGLLVNRVEGERPAA